MNLIHQPTSVSNSDNVVSFAPRPGLRGERRDPSLEPHTPITYANLRHLFDVYNSLIPASDWLALGTLFNKLKRGAPPSHDEGRLVRHLRATIRLRAEA